MTGCSAPNCSNNSRKGYKFYRFPADPDRRKIWLINCRRKDWNPTQNDRLCSAHFEESQIEQHRADGRKLLLPFAVPTIFNVSHSPKLNASRKSVYKLEDLDNFWQFNLMEDVCPKLKENMIPHISECQTSFTVPIERKEATKRKRQDLIEEALIEAKNIPTGTASSEASTSTDIEYAIYSKSQILTLPLREVKMDKAVQADIKLHFYQSKGVNTIKIERHIDKASVS